MDKSYYQELRDYAEECRSKEWQLKVWAKQPALVNKSKTELRKYVGQKYDSKQFNLVNDAWDHDHCQFCWASIRDCDCGECIKEAFEYKGRWICPNCFEHLIKNAEDPETYLKSLHKRT